MSQRKRQQWGYKSFRQGRLSSSDDDADEVIMMKEEEESLRSNNKLFDESDSFLYDRHNKQNKFSINHRQPTDHSSYSSSFEVESLFMSSKSGEPHQMDPYHLQEPCLSQRVISKALIKAGYATPPVSTVHVPPVGFIPTITDLSSLLWPRSDRPFYSSSLVIAKVSLAVIIRLHNDDDDFLYQFDDTDEEVLAVILCDNSASQVPAVIPAAAVRRFHDRLDGGCPLSVGDVLIISGIFVAVKPRCHLVIHELAVKGILSCHDS
jgi:hypothetical protein